MNYKKIWIILFLIAVGLTSCASQEAPVKGSLAPNFNAQTLHWEPVSLSKHIGKPVMLNFWATWCPPCNLEMPAIQERHERYSDELVILAINNNEPEDLVIAYEVEMGLSLDIVMDPGEIIQELYQIRGYPTSIFIDAEGIIQNIHVGLLTESQLDEYLAEIGIGE